MEAARRNAPSARNKMATSGINSVYMEADRKILESMKK
jgi:hypothetical protein